jgi:excisionase family DNA binding protein
MIMEAQPVMTLPEVAHYLRVHPSTIYRLMKHQQLPGLKLGHVWRFWRDQIDGWIERLSDHH